jgi:hypothetical protein
VPAKAPPKLLMSLLEFGLPDPEPHAVALSNVHVRVTVPSVEPQVFIMPAFNWMEATSEIRPKAVMFMNFPMI